MTTHPTPVSPADGLILATSDADARRSRHDAVLMRIAHLRRLPVVRKRQLTISRRLSRG